LDEPKVFDWQVSGDQHQYSNNQQLGVGGSREKGKFALWINQDLYKGNSNKVETYNNDILSKGTDFKCKRIEVWSLDD